MAIAIGRSSQLPVFWRLAGARLIVRWSAGKAKPEFLSAKRMRSRLSSMVLLAMPTIENALRPLEVAHSIITGVAVKPDGIAEYVVEVFMAGV